MDLSSAQRELYAADPAEFVKERDRLAKALQADGAKDAAAALRKARKPPVSVWALNRVAQTQADLIGELLEAGARMATVHDALARGQTGADFKATSAAYRRAIGAVSAAARSLLEAAGHGVDSGLTRRIERSLEALPFAPTERREALREGRLAEELAAGDDPFGAGGFGTSGDDLAALLAASEKPAAKPAAAKPKLAVAVADDGAADKARREALAREAKARRDAAAEAERAAARASAAAERVADEAAQARKRVESARAFVQAAEEELATAREREREASSVLAVAEAKIEPARRSAVELRAASERAAAAASQAEARARLSRVGGTLHSIDGAPKSTGARYRRRVHEHTRWLYGLGCWRLGLALSVVSDGGADTAGLTLGATVLAIAAGANVAPLACAIVASLLLACDALIEVIAGRASVHHAILALAILGAVAAARRASRRQRRYRLPVAQASGSSFTQQ